MTNAKEMTQESIINQKEVREQFLGKLEVLDKVKEIFYLPNTTLLTTKMVAEYYGVTEEVIKWHVGEHRKELEENGFKVLREDELKNFKADLTKIVKLSQFDIGARAKLLAVFSKRATLNIGMLLRDSEVAKQVRSALLDIEENVSEGFKNMIVTKEQEMMLAIDNAETEEEGKIALAQYTLYVKRNERKLKKALDEQSKLNESKRKYVLLNELGNHFNTKIGSKTVGRLLRIIGLAQMKSNDTVPYQNSVPKYAVNLLDFEEKRVGFVWQYENCVKKLDKWLKENDLYEDFYSITHQKDMAEFVRNLHIKHIENKRYSEMNRG